MRRCVGGDLASASDHLQRCNFITIGHMIAIDTRVHSSRLDLYVIKLEDPFTVSSQLSNIEGSTIT